MSRYAIAPHDPRYEVVVGWDPPMQTLFGQVFVTTIEDDDTACVLWVGLEVQALTTVAALQDALQAYATLPTAVVAQLEHDQAFGHKRAFGHKGGCALVPYQGPLGDRHG